MKIQAKKKISMKVIKVLKRVIKESRVKIVKNPAKCPK